MSSHLKVAALQLNPTNNSTNNINKAIEAIHNAQKQGAELIVLPELFIYRGNPSYFKVIAERKGGPITALFCSLAKTLQVHLVLGSIIEKSTKKNHYYDTTFCVSRNGEILCAYRKMNLFEVALKDTAVRERDYFLKGSRHVFADIDDHRIGCAICFDIRFPALFNVLTEQGVELFVVPSNFTFTTGDAHWETMVRARAIETQCYIIAANCCGIDPYSHVRSYGHSMIVDPWGTIITRLGDTEGIATAVIDFDIIKAIRKKMPLKK